AAWINPLKNLVNLLRKRRVLSARNGRIQGLGRRTPHPASLMEGPISLEYNFLFHRLPQHTWSAKRAARCQKKPEGIMKVTSPKEAYELMQSDPDCIYVDVRSVPEFEAGHAERALNIPLLHFSPGAGMSPNPDFQAVVEANLPKNARIIVGCKTGGRSAKAC